MKLSEDRRDEGGKAAENRASTKVGMDLISSLAGYMAFQSRIRSPARYCVYPFRYHIQKELPDSVDTILMLLFDIKKSVV